MSPSRRRSGFSRPAPQVVVVVVAVAAAVTAVLHPHALAAQPGLAQAQGFQLLGRSDSLVFAGEVQAGLQLLEDHLVRQPVDYHARWRAARAALTLGVLARRNGEERDAWMERAIEHGEAAVEAEPRGLDGLYWRAAAKGRLSLHQGARRAADLATEVWDEAHRILELDPRHAGAHNALGRLNLEVMILPGWKRTLGWLVVGGVLGRASWEDAEAHLVRAVQLDPGQVLYRRDLGQLYLRTDRPELARQVLEQVVAMRATRPADPVFQAEAAALLRDLERDAAGG